MPSPSELARQANWQLWLAESVAMDPHDDFADQDWLDDDWERRLLNGTVGGEMAVGFSKTEEWVKRCWAERRQHRREALSRYAARRGRTPPAP